MGPSLQRLGFLNSLFDFGFTSFITTRLVKVIYAVAMVVNLFYAFLIGVTVGVPRGGFVGTLLLLVVAPAVFIVLTMLARLWLELVVVIFRIAEQLRTVSDQLARVEPPRP